MKKFCLAIVALAAFAATADAQVIVRTRGVNVAVGRGVGFAPFFGSRAFFAPRVRVLAPRAVFAAPAYGYGHNNAFALRSFAAPVYAPPVVQQAQFFQQSYSYAAAPPVVQQAFVPRAFAAPATCGSGVQTYAPQLALAAPSCGAGGCGLPGTQAMLQRFGY